MGFAAPVHVSKAIQRRPCEQSGHDSLGTKVPAARIPALPIQWLGIQEGQTISLVVFLPSVHISHVRLNYVLPLVTFCSSRLQYPQNGAATPTGQRERPEEGTA